MDGLGGLEKKLKSLSKRTDEFLQALIDEQRHKEEEGNTMIDHMLSLQKLQPDYHTDQIIKGLILVSALNSASSLIEKTRKSRFFFYSCILKSSHSIIRLIFL